MKDMDEGATQQVWPCGVYVVCRVDNKTGEVVPVVYPTPPKWKGRLEAFMDKKDADTRLVELEAIDRRRGVLYGASRHYSLRVIPYTVSVPHTGEPSGNPAINVKPAA